MGGTLTDRVRRLGAAWRDRAGNGDGDGAVESTRGKPAASQGDLSRGRRFRTWVRGRGRWRLRSRVIGFALVGAAVALALAGRVQAEIGPFDATVGAAPSLAGETTVHLAPLGTIELDTHDWPLSLDLRADEIRPEEARRIARNPEVIDEGLGDDVAEDVRRALMRLAIRCALVAGLGAVAGALVARLHWHSAVAGVGIGALLVGCVGVGTSASFDANAVSEPRYTGLLTSAPTAVGDIEAIIDRYGEYRAQLSELVENVVTLYLAAESLPTFEPDGDTIRVLHVSDIHLNPQAFDLIAQLTEQFGVDVVADSGDITDWGTEPESRLVAEIGQLDVPYVFVRGNHDSTRTVDAVASQPNAVVLDGEAADVAGLRFWGFGDDRYTPNREDDDEHGPSQHEQAEALASEVADELARDEPPDADVVLIHDQRMAAELGGQVPLVLAGHRHEVQVSQLDPPEPSDDSSTTTSTESGAEPQETRLMVEGSTGGAGLRGLQGEEPTPLTATVLYFDGDTRQLVAYDRVTVQGFGETAATIERRILPQPQDDEGPT